MSLSAPLRAVRARPVIVAVSLAALALTATACLGDGGGTAAGRSGATDNAAGVRSSSTSTSTTTTDPNSYTVTADPAEGAIGVPPDHTVSITTTGAAIQGVAISSAVGAVDGAMSAEGNGWTSSGGLVPNTTYQVQLSLQRGDGTTAERQWSFTTAAAAKVFRATVSPGDGATVGVGMPVIVKLNTPVQPAGRAALEARLVVTADPAVTGAWHWFSPTELHWRPEKLWAAHTQVTVAANTAGFNAGNGAFGAANVNVHFAIGDAHVSIVDATKHQMAVFTNGALTKVIDVSTGRAKYPTHSGVHVVSEKKPSVTMDSATVGIPRDSPDGYFETVLWDVRISNSGEFVHAAPWSTGSQGSSNVSHGCVNVSTADGQWFYNYSNVGDVVQVVGTSIQLAPTNGIGDWQIPWAQWAN